MQIIASIFNKTGQLAEEMDDFCASLSFLERQRERAREKHELRVNEGMPAKDELNGLALGFQQIVMFIQTIRVTDGR